MTERGGAVLVAVLALAIPAWEGEAFATDAPETPGLRFSRVDHDFGAVPQGRTVTADFPFENVGVVPLTLSRPIVGCGCEAAIIGSMDLSPGDSGQVRFSCDTSQLTGPVRLTATIHSSEIARRAVVLTLDGEVVLDVLAQPSRVYLGKVLRGERKRGVFSMLLGSPGGRRVAIRGVDAPGRYIGVHQARRTNGFDVSIAAEAPLGQFTEDVVVSTSSERFPSVTVPVTGIVVDELPARRW